jgi:hypothetical protein
MQMRILIVEPLHVQNSVARMNVGLFSLPNYRAFGIIPIAALLAFGQAAIAQSDAHAVGQDCGRQIRSVCPWRFTPDAISSCVDENRASLSTTCQGFWDTANQCRAEMHMLCGDLNPFTIRNCIAEHRHRFSETCRAMFDLQ